MLFTELTKIGVDDIQSVLMQQLQTYGIESEVLQQKIEGKVTVEQLISDVVQQLLKQAAKANRESFRARQQQGFRQAKAGGKAVGRPSRKSPAAFAQICRMYELKEITGTQAAEMLGIARGTFYRWLKER